MKPWFVTASLRYAWDSTTLNSLVVASVPRFRLFVNLSAVSASSVTVAPQPGSGAMVVVVVPVVGTMANSARQPHNRSFMAGVVVALVDSVGAT
jgi:hypothetical protein